MSDDADRQTHWTVDEMDSDQPSLALVEAVAQAKGIDSLALAPLGDCFDTEALDEVLQSPPGLVEVTVNCQGFRATVSSGGSIELRPLDSGRAGSADE
ncbi:HalOD1 output domain-containing protein [Halobacterium wangiae]|uniref:HalOD1 output domain-containing protein n=1 Tax=Halobacterium wangiae TaxID=2902623 RepID=UPI001E64A392|nr:HalOD1 output domain-containing protein [Halobacterium wangiae]